MHLNNQKQIFFWKSSWKTKCLLEYSFSIRFRLFQKRANGDHTSEAFAAVSDILQQFQFTEVASPGDKNKFIRLQLHSETTFLIECRTFAIFCADRRQSN